jgi:hypothetical protein
LFVCICVTRGLCLLSERLTGVHKPLRERTGTQLTRNNTGFPASPFQAFHVHHLHAAVATTRRAHHAVLFVGKTDPTLAGEFLW